MSDPLPPLPPGFALDEPKPKRSRLKPVPPPPEGFTLDGAVHDGDTVGTQQGVNLRLYGVDAPELDQQGLGQLGPVAIGQQSRGALADLLHDAPIAVGPIVGNSYGRPVASLTANGLDVGHTLARDGAALAAPEYIAADPERRFDYLQAERLARQNGLGIHATRFQPPAEYRQAPVPVDQLTPERATVAQFWDTPTPLAGMRPEVEKTFIGMINDRKITPEQVAAYARDNGGFVVDPADVAKSRGQSDKAGGKPIGMGYRGAPKVMTDQGDGATGAVVRGIGNGVLPNWLEETGALADTLGVTPGRENVWNSERRLADIWANNEAQNESITAYDRFAHPYAETAGELAGGLVPFVPAMKAETTAANLAKIGGAYGFVAGAGREGSIPERLSSGIVGAGEGMATTVLGGKALEAAAPYAARALRRVIGKSPVGAPEASLGEFGGDIPPPPTGFKIDAPEAVQATERVVANSPALEDSDPPGPRSVLDFQPKIGKPGISVTNEDGHLATAVYRDENGIARGAAQIPISPEARDLYEAANVYVDPELRRQGIASKLYDALRREGHPIDSQSGSGNLTPSGAAFVNARNQAMEADAGGSLTQPVSRPDMPPARMDTRLSEAQLRARAAEVQPGDVLPIASNEIGSVDEAAAKDAGRYAEAKPVNERSELTRQTVRAWNGAEVPKVGPTDMVGWLRLRGGLADQGGELSHIGMANGPRRGMDFVGQEQRFGPLVNPKGMTLDDAARAAWEAGYFPERTDRPSVNEFLDALRDTYEGRNRRFLPQDHAEIDRFHGAQADRYALEQQLQEGPVYNDRSQPAGPDQPFAPPEAYEEWPAGGPDFAGNINLGKLDTPQDIRRALATTEQRVGFDAATRGRVTQAETEALAADLGMTPEQLLSRRKGQALNAEEALAARQILAKSGNELVNMAKRIRSMDEPGDDLLAQFRQAWVRHAALQEQVAGATAEAGRTLAQFKMMASSKAVRGDVLSAMVNSGGGRGRIRDAAETLLETVEAGPGAFNAVVEKGSKPRFRDKLTELWINWLLSSPATHAVNMTSNTLTAMAQLPEHLTAAGIGGVRRMAGRGEDAITAHEVGVRAFALLQGAKEGIRLFAQSARTGEPSDLVSKVEGIGMKAISGRKGEVVRIPTRFLTAEDELFKGIARRMEINGLAVRIARREGLKGEALQRRIADLSQYPTDDMLQRSMDYARYVTFQSKLGPAGSKISALTADVPALKLFLPFVRTPTNLLKFATERSPLAPLLKEWRQDFGAGGARRDLAVSKILLGTGMGMAIYEAALQGRITGSAPTDPAKARLMYADGFQPYSIRIGDKWYSYKRLDPFSTTLGVAADMALLPEGMSERQKDDKTTLLVASILGNLANKTWLSGVSDLLGAITDPGQNADNLVQRLAGSLAVPTGVAQLARTMDPVQRKVDSVGDAIQARIPGASEGLLPRRDVWGREVTSEGGVGPDIVSPAYVSTAQDDPVNRELLRAGVSVGLPSRKVAGVELSAQQYDRYQAEAGQRAYAGVKALVSSEAWKRLDDEAKQDAVGKIVKQARAEARGVLPDGGRAGKGAVPPPPPGFTVEGAAGGRNVYADLLKFLPAENITSGFRTPEYQAELKRRGYHPADNSRHLDGSAFDLVPPAGKSMGWLQARLKAYDPQARFYPEGDHLHVSFPGYYGAPAIGGARRAGLRNPLMGMPPPPPGFSVDR